MHILRWFDRVSEAAAMDARKASILAALLKYRASPLARRGRRRGTCKPASARAVCFTLALSLMTALLVDPALPEDAGAGATGQSEIRLGMSPAFSATARDVSIELYPEAM